MTEQTNLLPKRRFKEFQNSQPWKQCSLGSIATFNPKAELPKKFKYVDLESVRGIEIIAHREETKSTAPSRAQRLAKQGDLFYQTVRPYQKNNHLFAKNDDNYVFSTGYAQMRPTCNGYFLLNLVQTDSFVKSVLDKCTGTSYPVISSNDLEKMHVIVTNNEAEQTKIGIFFKQLDNHINLQQRKLEKIKLLKDAYLLEMFPAEGEFVPKRRFSGFTQAWKKRKLGEITDSFSGGTPSVNNRDYYNGSIPFIRSGEINSNTTELFINDNAMNNSSAKLVAEGDILYALYGATSGEVGISQINGAINQAVLAIKPKFDDDSYLITQWLKKQKQVILSTYLQGGQGNLSGNIVKNLIIDLPTNKEEQAKIGSFFKQLDKIIAHHQCKLDKLQNLKNAYLHEMFV